MRVRTLAAVVLLVAPLSCGGPDDAARTDPEAASDKAPGANEQPAIPANFVQLFLRYERDQHDLVRVPPGPCG
jgi:hypothetical protein